MQQRNPIAVAVLSLITFGIYGIYWFVVTKNEMNAKGASIPTAWLIIIPFVNWWWLWKYSEGVELVTNKQTSAILSFVLLFLVSIVGMAILQNEFNNLGSPAAAAGNGGAPTPPAPSEPAAPTPPSTPPAA